MILLAYRKVEGARAELEMAARRAFPSIENCIYIDEIAQRKNESAAIEGLTALLLLYELLENIGADASSLVLRRGINGKPFFEGSQLHFNISHSHGAVAVALSDSGAVGIDIEAADITDDKAERLCRRYFGKVNVAPSREEFLRLWVRTEAYVKLCGSTLSDGIRAEIPANVNFFDLEIFGAPAAVSYFGEQSVKTCSRSSDSGRFI